MAKIVFSSANARGIRRAGFVEARTLSEAERILREGGHVQIRYHSDPNVGDACGDDPERLMLNSEARDRTSASPWPFVGGTVVALGAAAGGFVLLITGRWLLSIVPFAATFYIVAHWLPPRLYEQLRFAMYRRDYARAHVAFVVHRWLRRLTPLPAALGPILVTEEACILAGSGRMERALTLLESLRPEHERLYQCSLASLYDHARDFEAVVRVQRELVEREPELAGARLDLALNLALRFGDLAGAREQLDRAAGRPETEIVRGLAPFVEGIVALPGDPARARERIDVALRSLEGRPAVLVHSWLALMRAYRARASALLGDLESAERDLREASPVLIEGGEHAIVDESWEIIRAARPVPYRA